MKSFDEAVFASMLQRDNLTCENLNRKFWEGLHAFKGMWGNLPIELLIDSKYS